MPSSLGLAHKTVPRGGGQGAFASDASRMGGEAEEGDEVVGSGGEGMRQRRGFVAEGEAREGERLRFDERERGGKGSGKGPGKLVWNRFKWCIFAANLVVRLVSGKRRCTLISMPSCILSVISPWSTHPFTFHSPRIASSSS